MNQSRSPLTWCQGIKIGLRPQVGHFKRAALAIIQQKRGMGYRGDSLALVTIVEGSLPAERRQRCSRSFLGVVGVLGVVYHLRSGTDVFSFVGGVQIYGLSGIPSGVQDLTYWSGSAAKSGICSL